MSFIIDCIKATWQHTAVDLNLYLSYKIGQSCEAIFKRAFEARFKTAKWAMNNAIRETNAHLSIFVNKAKTFIPIS